MNKLIAISIFVSICSIAIAQQKADLTVHEWGTFTTLYGPDGKLFKGVNVEEEALPSFVKSLSMKRFGVPDPDKGWPTEILCYPADVTVKMETPVLYFYTDKQTDFTINVGFNSGLITQWYPSATSVTPNIIQSCNGPVYLQSLKGNIQWQGTILAPQTKDTLTQPAKSSHTWLAPRATKSNLIKSYNGEVEKYLFYRGLGSFDIPLKMHFDDNGRLNIRNTDKDGLGFVMVYNNTPQGAEVWWMGKIGSGEEVKIIPVVMPGKSVYEAMKDFTNALVEAGLYKDEAEAMLSTWKKSYFETEGLRVFWIVPRHLTDEILPLQMNPSPKKLERVLVGRSEILTPEFEQLVYKLYHENTRPDTVFMHNRYAGIYRLWYLQMTGAPDTPGKTGDMVFYVYPNPTSDGVNVYIENCKEESGEISVFDATGRKIYTSTVSRNGSGNILMNIDMTAQTAGVYTVLITLGDKIHTEKVVFTK